MTSVLRKRGMGVALLAGFLLAASIAAPSAQAATAAEPVPPSSFLGPQKPLTGEIQHYVALGDSYASGPLIPTQRLSTCFRSTNNFATWLAYNRGLVGSSGAMNKHFQDVSCASATTGSMAGPQKEYVYGVKYVSQPPQLNAITPDTDLVTISIGGNDESLFGTLITDCPQLRSFDPEGAPCQAINSPSGVDKWASVLKNTQAKIGTVLAGIKARAPKATVLVVGYGRIAPKSGTCDALPMAKGDYQYIDAENIRLNQALANAARAQGVGYVDTYGPGASHTVCGANPWINGATTNLLKAAAYHPTKAGMIATADMIDNVLRGQVSANPSLVTPATATLGGSE